MANQKQRRRRAKEKRHAYELVEIDSEGNETVLTASTLKTISTRKAKLHMGVQAIIYLCTATMNQFTR